MSIYVVYIEINSLKNPAMSLANDMPDALCNHRYILTHAYTTLN